ncbi:MAG: TonB family protein [Sterolibacterium sp.]|nr:TonB family protein [Sterolibacterium sp.]
MLSLLLHVLVISLQFGEYGNGMPWFGIVGEARITSIPTLNAILRSQAPAEIPAPNELTEHVFGKNVISSGPLQTRKSAPPKLPVPREPAIASIGETKVALPPQEAGEKRRVAEPAAEVTKTEVPEGGIAVLSTDEESTWRQHVAKATLEEEKAKNDQLIKQKAEEAQAIEQKMIEDQAQIQAEKAEKTQQAAIAKAKEDTLARQKAEDQARIEAEKAKQAAELRAREEIMAKRAEEEAMARKRQMEAAKLAERAAAERNQAAERNTRSLPNVAAGKPEGGKEEGAGQVTDKGGDLARRALDMARSGLSGLPARESSEAARSRRGSILGRDPKDIQLAFYGEGWRLKIERIGSMNYPRLSKNLAYDPLVVTVSINSDGTLAGLRIEKSSGHKGLDEAVRRIVEMSAPFAAFPPDLKRSYDVVDITRTWTFLEERPRITGQ